MDAFGLPKVRIVCTVHGIPNLKRQLALRRMIPDRFLAWVLVLFSMFCLHEANMSPGENHKFCAPTTTWSISVLSESIVNLVYSPVQSREYSKWMMSIYMQFGRIAVFSDRPIYLVAVCSKLSYPGIFQESL